MPPAISESLLVLRRLQNDIQIQFLSTFYIFCAIKEAMIEFEETRTMAEEQGTSSVYLTRLHSILQSLQALQASVISLLDFSVKYHQRSSVILSKVHIRH
jgi:hypothetical protein